MKYQEGFETFKNFPTFFQSIENYSFPPSFLSSTLKYKPFVVLLDLTFKIFRIQTMANHTDVQCQNQPLWILAGIFWPRPLVLFCIPSPSYKRVTSQHI